MEREVERVQQESRKMVERAREESRLFFTKNQSFEREIEFLGSSKFGTMFFLIAIFVVPGPGSRGWSRRRGRGRTRRGGRRFGEKRNLGFIFLKIISLQESMRGQLEERRKREEQRLQQLRRQEALLAPASAAGVGDRSQQEQVLLFSFY